MDSSLHLASAAAQRAGKVLASSFGNAQLQSATRRDVKLAEDQRAQDLIVAHLGAHSHHPILTEESGWIGSSPAADAPYWVVDPLDGSFNYLYGLPLCCVSIALCRGMTPLAGCVHDFLRGETFAGGPGLGLHLNGEPVVATAAAEASGILSTGLPAGGRQDGTALAGALQQWRKLRLLGTAALSLAWVAQGRMAAYHEDGIRWWDVAAGLALVGAAGGRIEVCAATDEAAGGQAGPELRLEVRAWGAGVASGATP